MTKFWNFCKRFYLAILLIFIYLPILMLMVFSFNNGKSMTKWQGFTFKWYGKLFSNSLILNSIWVTLSIALISSLVSTIVGTLAAVGIEDYSKRKKNFLLTLSQIPMINADIVTGISLLLFFIFIKVPRGYTTMLLSHIVFNTPYVIFSVLPRLRGMDEHLYEAALDMGAKPFYALRKVIIPQLMPGIVSGFVMAFTMSFDDFVISFFASQGIVSNLSIYIYSMAKVGISPEINALSTIMFIAVITLLIITNIKSIKQNPRKKPNKNKKNVPVKNI